MASSNDDNQGRAWPGTAACLSFAGNAQLSSARDVGQPHAWLPPGTSIESRSRSGLASQELTGLADPCFGLPLFVRACIGLNPERNVVRQATGLQDEM